MAMEGLAEDPMAGCDHYRGLECDRFFQYCCSCGVPMDVCDCIPAASADAPSSALS